MVKMNDWENNLPALALLLAFASSLFLLLSSPPASEVYVLRNTFCISESVPIAQ